MRSRTDFALPVVCEKQKDSRLDCKMQRNQAFAPWQLPFRTQAHPFPGKQFKWQESAMARRMPSVICVSQTSKIRSMNRPIGIALLVAGIVLIIFGINASQSFSSDVSRFFTGNPTDKSMWFLIGGILAAVVGLFLSFGRSIKS